MKDTFEQIVARGPMQPIREWMEDNPEQAKEWVVEKDETK